jgi:hypothetical protein
MWHLRWYILALAALGTVAPASDMQGDGHRFQHIEAGPIRVELSVSRESMNIAESLAVTLEVAAPSSVRVELPRLGDKLGNFSVSSVSDEPALSEPAGAGTQTRCVRRITLEPFLPGDYTMPAMEIHWRRVDSDESGVARTTPETIRVVSLLPEAAQGADADLKTLDTGTIRDRYTPASAGRWGPVTLVACAGLGVAFLTGCGALALRRRRGNKDPLAAIVSRIEVLGRDVDVDTPAFCQELGRSLRAGLSQRVDARAASLLATEVADRLPTDTFFSKQLALDCERTLGALDEARFSGMAMTADERSTLHADTLSILRTLLAMPRQAEGRA